MGKWLVCAAWPYINAIPHLGTLIGSVLSADVFARYLRLKGEDVVYVSGSDEHGTPIEVEAIRRNISPKEYTDKMHEIVSDLFKKWGISFDNYTRTENPIHIEFVRGFYKKIEKNGYVFTKIQQLPYCPNCKRFLPDRFVEGVCPYCGYEKARGDQCDNCGRLLEPIQLVNPHCVICGATPEIRETKHWFFNLSAFQDKLKEYIENNKNLPDNAKNFSLQLIKEGLKPRSLTRDNKWGIPAPFEGAKDKTIYVWMEAVLGYISATIEWSIKTGQPEKWKEYWFDSSTKSVYFIGKDNIPFHTLIFPALLMATHENYTLPWNAVSTEYLQFEGEKFSKSRGIGIWADEALKLFPVDYFRYVVISIRPEKHDTSFRWDVFKQLVNDELNDIIGNFIHRTLTFIYNRFNGEIPKLGDLTEDDKKVLKRMEIVTEESGKLLEKFRYNDALSTVVSLMHTGNQYLSNTEPWALIKKNKERASTILNICAQLVASFAILIEPFMPFTAERIWKELLNMPGSVHEQNWERAKTPILKEGHKINKPVTLFKKIPKDVDLNEIRSKEIGKT
ncbi:MAG: methionine--tRNA ligase [Candidatus Asgardarchaeia archaeon]